MSYFRLLDTIPTDPEVIELAAAVRRKSRQAASGVVDLRRVCTVAGATVRQAPLAGADGGQDAMLMPLAGDRFGITVDPTPPGGWRRVPKALRIGLKRHRCRFRIGHELAHTFFYERGHDVPRRHLFDSREQEDFCDAFSRELLVPHRRATRSRPTPRALFRLQASCDVSLELAARALAAAHREVTLALWFVPPDEAAPKLQWASGSSVQTAIPEPAGDGPQDGFEWLSTRRQLLFLA